MTCLGEFRFDLLSRAVRERLMADGALCQADVARASGVSKATVTRLLAGQVIGAGPVLKLCRWLGRDPYDLLESNLLEAGGARGEVSA
jgi:DNA-binding Xre family transcriptional regulator